MYRKLMMLMAVVAVLGLAIGLVGCPQKAAPPTGVGGSARPGGAPGGPPGPPLIEEEVPAEEAPAEEAPAEEAPAEEAPAAPGE